MDNFFIGLGAPIFNPWFYGITVLAAALFVIHGYADDGWYYGGWFKRAMLVLAHIYLAVFLFLLISWFGATQAGIAPGTGGTRP